MPDQIPPPGPERDAEIMKGLGWQPTVIGRGHFLHGVEDITHWKRPDGSQTGIVPPYSTDSACADRLAEEMVRRGYQLVHRSDRQGHGARFMVDDPTASDGLAFYEGRGATRPDAVSAAALLALRGGA